MIAVYALSNIDCPDDIYIGSSKNIKDRMKNHKCDCDNVNGKKYNRKVYTFIRENGGFQKWKYHIIEEFDVYDKIKLKEREDYWMLELKSSLNSQRADHCRSDIWKEYYLLHKDELNAKQFCECGGQYTFKNRLVHFKTKKCRKYMASIISI